MTKEDNSIYGFWYLLTENKILSISKVGNAMRRFYSVGSQEHQVMCPKSFNQSMSEAWDPTEFDQNCVSADGDTKGHIETTRELGTFSQSLVWASLYLLCTSLPSASQEHSALCKLLFIPWLLESWVSVSHDTDFHG